jgi:hypothetical protein
VGDHHTAACTWLEPRQGSVILNSPFGLQATSLVSSLPPAEVAVKVVEATLLAHQAAVESLTRIFLQAILVARAQALKLASRSARAEVDLTDVVSRPERRRLYLRNLSRLDLSIREYSGRTSLSNPTKDCRFSKRCSGSESRNLAHH